MGIIFLIRHGETDWHVENRILGRRDISLNQRGWEQARLLEKRFAEEKLTSLYSSPLKRCRDTINPLASLLGKKPEIVPDLTEIDFGEWDGQLVKEIISNESERFKKWLARPGTAHIPGGERLEDVKTRVARGMNEIIGRHSPEDNLLVVAHGGPIRMVFCIVLSLDIDRIMRIEVDLASVTAVKFFGDTIEHKVSAFCLNDTAHLGSPMSGR